MKVTLEPKSSEIPSVRSVSYKEQEKVRLKRMEDELMEYYGCDYSGLHKILVRDANGRLVMIR